MDNEAGEGESAPSPRTFDWEELRVVAMDPETNARVREMTFLSGAKMLFPTHTVVTGQSIVEGKGVLPIHSEVSIVEGGLVIFGKRATLESLIGRWKELKLKVEVGWL